MAASCYSRPIVAIIQLFRVKSGVQGRVLDKQIIEAAISSDIHLR